jgi:hypothetical protein
MGKAGSNPLAPASRLQHGREIKPETFDDQIEKRASGAAGRVVVSSASFAGIQLTRTISLHHAVRPDQGKLDGLFVG